MIFYKVSYILNDRMYVKRFESFNSMFHFCITIINQGGKITHIKDECGNCLFYDYLT